MDGTELIKPKNSLSNPLARIKKLKNKSQVLKMIPLITVAAKKYFAFFEKLWVCNLNATIKLPH
jgi:superfamily II helicase